GRLLDQPDLVGLGVALAAAAGREVGGGVLVFLREVEAVQGGQGHGLAGVGVGVGCVGLVFPAAGIGAGALVGVAPVEIAREQAAPRIGDAQRAVYEDFQLGVGAVVADGFDLVQTQFARQDDAADALPAPELHGRAVGGVGLHRQVDRYLGP